MKSPSQSGEINQNISGWDFITTGVFENLIVSN